MSNKAENVNSFKSLIKMYESLLEKKFIIKEEEISFHVFSIYTGFGATASCILCKELDKKGFTITNSNKAATLKKTKNVDCSKCVYKIVTGYTCNKGINKETYNNICEAATNRDITYAINKRIKHTKRILNLYNKLQDEEI